MDFALSHGAWWRWVLPASAMAAGWVLVVAPIGSGFAVVEWATPTGWLLHTVGLIAFQRMAWSRPAAVTLGAAALAFRSGALITLLSSSNLFFWNSAA
jgi:hypothetical protein